MICKESVSGPKEYKLRCQCETECSDFNQKHSGEFRKQKVASLVQALNAQ
jgi:hypothetical protein